LSIGDPIVGARITGNLDLDPLVISRWVCGEDLRGIYQPIILHECEIERLDLSGRTFYEMVELIDCTIEQAALSQAYFYDSLVIGDTRFEGPVDGRYIQADGRVVVHDTLFTHYLDVEGLSLRQHSNFSAVSFTGGTNFLHYIEKRHFPAGVSLQGCSFRPEDVPAGFDLQAYKSFLLLEGKITAVLECE